STSMFRVCFSLLFLTFFFFTHTATTEIYTLSYTTLFRSKSTRHITPEAGRYGGVLGGVDDEVHRLTLYSVPERRAIVQQVLQAHPPPRPLVRRTAAFCSSPPPRFPSRSPGSSSQPPRLPRRPCPWPARRPAAPRCPRR